MRLVRQVVIVSCFAGSFLLAIVTLAYIYRFGIWAKTGYILASSTSFCVLLFDDLVNLNRPFKLRNHLLRLCARLDWIP